MAISGLSVFGGGGVTQYIEDGATAKLVSQSATGVLLDVQESGVFTISPSANSSAIITIDGVSFSGSDTNILGSLYGVQTTGDYTIPMPYNKSLKVEVTSYTAGTFSVYRIS